MTSQPYFEPGRGAFDNSLQMHDVAFSRLPLLSSYFLIYDWMIHYLSHYVNRYCTFCFQQGLSSGPFRTLYYPYKTLKSLQTALRSTQMPVSYPSSPGCILILSLLSAHGSQSTGKNPR